MTRDAWIRAAGLRQWAWAHNLAIGQTIRSRKGLALLEADPSLTSTSKALVRRICEDLDRLEAEIRRSRREPDGREVVIRSATGAD